jgi:hypothetical protein
MALVNPNIAMSYRAPEIQQPNMLADYAAIQQIQGGRQTQELNALKMQEARDTMQERNALRQLNPTAADYESQLFKVSPTLGIQYRKERSTAEAQQAATKLSEAKTAETSLDISRKKLKYAWESVGDASTPNLAIQKIADGIKDGVFSQQDGAAEIEQLRDMTPESFRQYRINKISQILDAKDKFGAMLPKIARQDTGSALTPIQDNPALPGYGLPVAGMAPIAKTETFADVNARKRLAFDQNKFNWEKANPGFELKEADDGSIVGVNKRTLQAFPVTIGGGPAPAAAPAAGGTGMPSARVPAPQAPLAGATPTAARPLMGKGQALTESQGNATAFGMRMIESQKALTDLENAGVVSGGRIKGAVEGTLKSLVPFQGEQLAEGAGAIMNVLPSFAGGPSSDQQLYQQAKTNFITAVLRKESGAAIGLNEFQTEDRKYFPQAGDTDKVVERKRKARQLAIESMKIQAGPGAKNIGSAGGAGGTGVDTNNPLLNR